MCCPSQIAAAVDQNSYHGYTPVMSFSDSYSSGNPQTSTEKCFAGLKVFFGGLLNCIWRVFHLSCCKLKKYLIILMKYKF